MSRQQRRAYDKELRKQEKRIGGRGKPTKSARAGERKPAAPSVGNYAPACVDRGGENLIESSSAMDGERDGKDDAAVEGDYLTPRQACRMLAISRSTLDRLPLPGRVKLGGQVRFQRKRLEQWLEQQMS